MRLTSAQRESAPAEPVLERFAETQSAPAATPPGQPVVHPAPPLVHVGIWANLKWAFVALAGTLLVWRVAPVVLEFLGLDELGRP